MKPYNYLAIGIAALVSFALDLIWFTMLFASPYIEDLGRSKAQLDQGPDMITAFIIQIVANITIAFVIAWLVRKLNYQTVAQSMQLAILVWLAFIVCIIGPMYAFQAFSFRFFLIIVFGYLIPVVVSAAIITAWKKR